MNEDKEKPTVFHFKPKPKDENHAGPNQHENQAKTRSAIKKKEKKQFERTRRVQVLEETPAEAPTEEKPAEETPQETTVAE